MISNNQNIRRFVKAKTFDSHKWEIGYLQLIEEGKKDGEDFYSSWLNIKGEFGIRKERVISSSISQGTTLLIPDINGVEKQVFEGDIIAVYDTQYKWREFVVGWDNKGLQLGMCPTLIFVNELLGSKDSFIGRPLRIALATNFVRLLPYHSYDMIENFKKTGGKDMWYDIHLTARSIEVPEYWTPIVNMC